MAASRSKTQDDLLIKTAVTVELLNTRLFGGDGQPGALPYLLEQTKELRENLNQNKAELLKDIDEKKDTLLNKIDAVKASADLDVDAINGRVDKIEGKVSWLQGGVAAIYAAATLGLSWLGISHKG